MNGSVWERAQRVLVGGVNSPVRAFRAVGGQPRFIARAKGSRLFDEDGKEYLDFVGSWGPAILGHAHPEVVAAVQTAAEGGLSFGAPTLREVELAEQITRRIPSIEMLRLVSSGTEATMSALRVARGYTGRPLILKFDGCYHGHSDGLLVAAGSGAVTFGNPDSAGVPADIVKNTLSLPFNDTATLKRTFAEHQAQIAAVIVEPVVGNMGCVPPENGFLAAIIEECRRSGAVSIFDEVMTGCRLSPSGAQGLYGLTPDLTCLGKIVGGGMPLAAYGGKRAIMEKIAPLGPVYQAGTLSGNPLSVAAAQKTLELLGPDAYAMLESLGQRLESGVQALAAQSPRALCFQRVGSMFTLFFQEGPVRNFPEAKQSDTQAFAAFHQHLLAEGIYFPPSQFEAAFLSLAHTEADIDRTLSAMEKHLVHS